MTATDWKQEADYVYTDDLSFAGWAWEFLRRGKAYSETWADFTAEVQELEELSGIDREEVLRTPKFVPARHPGESIPKWKMRCHLQVCADEMFQGTIAEFYAKSFFLRDMHPPDMVWNASIEFFPPSALPELLVFPEQLEPYVADFNEIDDETGQVVGGITAIDTEVGVIVFDLTKKIGHQLKAATAKLLEHRNKGAHAVTMNGQLWKTYLRLLDARHACASTDCIVEVIYPDPSVSFDRPERVGQQLKQARQWCKSAGIRKLLKAHFQSGT